MHEPLEMAKPLSPLVVDILDATTLKKTGTRKSVVDAWLAGDWIGSFNLWVVQREKDRGFLLYQQRIATAGWAPNMLDATVGGHYQAGEEMKDGLREAREEVGKNYRYGDLIYLGKKLSMFDAGDFKRRYAVDVFLVEDNQDLDTFTPEQEELQGIYRCPIDELIHCHLEPSYAFDAEGIAYGSSGLQRQSIRVNHESFPTNWDKYHLKMALLVRRYMLGDSNLLY